MTLYDRYKPFRNKLRSYKVWTGLGSVFCYSQFLEGERALPDQLYNRRLHQVGQPVRAGIFPWTVELLAKELILHAEPRSGKPLTDGWTFVELLHDIVRLEDIAWGAHPDRADDILVEMSRIAYRQFPWQAGFSSDDVTRQFVMLSEPALARTIEAEFGLSVVELFQLILLVKEEMTHQPMLQMKFSQVSDPAVLPALNDLARRLGKPIEAMRKLAADAQSYDVNWAYTFNPLREFPLVHAGYEPTMMCPLPILFARRLTEGLYYDLIRRGDDAHSLFGQAFEAYCGRAAAQELGGHMRVLPEAVYGKPERRSVDWIIEDPSATLFVECKLARPTLEAQTMISESDPLGAALKRLADAVAQTYATLSDALGGAYPHWRSDGRPLYPMVVTLYDWFTFGPFMMRRLNDHIDTAFAARGLDTTLLERFPYTIASVREFEALLAVLRSTAIHAVMHDKVRGEAREWMLQPYLGQHFSGALHREAPIFAAQINAIIYGPSRFTRMLFKSETSG